MMKIRIVILVLCLFLAGLTHVSARFEGSYTVEVHPAKTQKKARMMTMKVSIKGDRMVSQPLSGLPDNMKDMRVIVNQSDKSVISLMDMNGSKMGMKSSINDKDLKEAEELQFTKTGNTKTIQGFVCEEYVGETDKQKIVLWVSPELTKKFSGTLSPFAGQRIGGKDTRKDGIFNNSAGFPLESSLTEKKSGDVTHIYIKDILEGKVDESLFNMDGYQVMERPFGK